MLRYCKKGDLIVPNDAARVISAHRIPGERLLWAGRPKQGLAFRGWDVLYVPFGGLLLVGGSIFIVLAISETGDPFLALFLSLWLLAAAYMAVGRFFVDARRRASTYYAVTSMRALIISGKELGRVQSVNLRSLQEITFTRRADNTGTIEFDRHGGWFQQRFDMSRGTDSPFLSYDAMRTPAFEMIENPRDVEALILSVRDEARAAAPG